MKLMGQFVDRKTSALMRRLAGREDIVAELENNGDILIAGEYMGRLTGLHVERDPRLKGAPAGTARAAVEKTVGEELRARAGELAADDDAAFSLTDSGQIVWRNAAVADLAIADKNDRLGYLAPEAQLLADEVLTGEARQRAQTRLTDWLRNKIKIDLAPLVDMQGVAGLEGLARGLAFQLLENKGSLPRREVADILSKLDQPLRGQLRKLGVRFGFYTIFMPALLKPTPARLLALLSLLQDNQGNERPRPVGPTLDALPAPGLTSSPRAALPFWLYRAAGFYTTQNRAIRLDMLERLADIIRPLLADKAPGFQANEAMMSIMGCGAEELAEILTALGYQSFDIEADKLPPPASAQMPAPNAIKAEDAITETAMEKEPSQEATQDASQEATRSQPVDQPADQPSDQPVTETTSDIMDTAPSQSPDALTENEAATDADKGTDADADKGTDADTDKDADTNKDTAKPMVTLWRQARSKSNRRSAKKSDKQPGSKSQNRGPNGSKTSARPPHKARRNQPREKQADPNSPFAVLKNLQDGGAHDG
jgi:ATP-dependent RNA helicase SUPV3L1/SUV3